MTQWVPLYQSSEEVVKTEIATFVQAFPQATLWNSDSRRQGYDLVLLGQREPLRIDVPGVLERLGRLRQVQSSLAQVGFQTLADLLSTYISSGTDLGPWLKGAEINRDLLFNLGGLLDWRTVWFVVLPVGTAYTGLQAGLVIRAGRARAARRTG